MLAVAKHQPNCMLEFDCHPFRTEAAGRRAKSS